MKTYLLLVSLSLFIVGCSSSGNIYQNHRPVAENKAQLVIFRPDTLFQGGIPYQVSINGNNATILKNGGYKVLNTQPGETIIEVTGANWFQPLWHNPSLKLSTQLNDRVFIKITPVTGNGAAIDVISEENATPELKTLRESQ